MSSSSARTSCVAAPRSSDSAASTRMRSSQIWLAGSARAERRYPSRADRSASSARCASLGRSSVAFTSSSIASRSAAYDASFAVAGAVTSVDGVTARERAIHDASAGSSSCSASAGTGSVTRAASRRVAESTRVASSARPSPSRYVAVSACVAPSEDAYRAARSGSGDEPNTRYPASLDASGIATRNTGRSSRAVSSANRSTRRRASCRAHAPARGSAPRAPKGTTAMTGRGLTVLAEAHARVVALPHLHDVFAARRHHELDVHPRSVHLHAALLDDAPSRGLALLDRGAHEQVDDADLALAVGLEGDVLHI